MTASATLALATQDLKKRYGSQVALNGLNLEVPAGIVYGFLGPNGAGKTTTMRLLTGLIRPDHGSIRLMGEDFTGANRHLLHNVGALIESPSFYPHLSARDNLRVIGASGKAVTRNRVEEMLELVGLRDRARDKVSNYSLGMRQRLGHRRCAPQRSTAAPPRRAGQRPGPGRHRGSARHAEDSGRGRQDGLHLQPHPARGAADGRHHRHRLRRQAGQPGPAR